MGFSTAFEDKKNGIFMYQHLSAISSHGTNIDPLVGAFKINYSAVQSLCYLALSIAVHYLLLSSFLFITPFLFTIQPLI